jgi:hypothetical protein
LRTRPRLDAQNAAPFKNSGHRDLVHDSSWCARILAKSFVHEENSFTSIVANGRSAVIKTGIFDCAYNFGEKKSMQVDETTLIFVASSDKWKFELSAQDLEHSK